ncbi:hypothetical protein GCM10029964_029980 [Kibdelosporangium lantanae]
MRAGLTADDLPATLNVYSCRPYDLTCAEVWVVELLANHGSLAAGRTRADAHREQLLRALATRDVIRQAKGILMQPEGVSAGEAFDLLRRASQDMNVKVADLARTIADRHADL